MADAGAGAPLMTAFCIQHAPAGDAAAARVAASSWTWVAATAAVAGSSPAASSAPITPVRTSPEPAVAGQDERAGLASPRPPGAATIVVFPLSRTTALNRFAASRVAATRSGPGALP